MPMKSSRQRAWIVLALIALLIVVGLVVRSAFGPAVKVSRISRAELTQTLVANGKVLAPAKVQIGTTLLGVVDHVDVEEGQQIKKGALLLQLHHEEMLAQVEQAKAGVAAAQIRLEQVRAVRAPVAAQEMKQAQISVDQAQTQFERLADLMQKGATTRVDFDKAQTDLELARSRYLGASLQAANTSSAGIEYRLALAALSQSQASLAQANARLAETSVSAPADSVVLERRVEPGDVVQPGKVLLVLARLGETQVEVAFDEGNLGLLKIGQKARVAAEAFLQQQFDAELRFIAPAVDPQRGTVDVRFVVPTPPSFLLTDMTATVDVEVARRADALVVPARAVRDASSGAPWVLVLRDGHIERVDVTLGVRGELSLEIVQGLESEALVVTEGQQSLVPGQRARAVEEGA
ncbi:MAG: efflux RND transporter periplasmic adaptor subunit [Pseudomonadota bacterium]